MRWSKAVRDALDAGEIRSGKLTLMKLLDCQRNRDTVVAHADADDALCELLRELGYQEVVAAWERVAKWYA